MHHTICLVKLIVLMIHQRKKFVDEGKSLMEHISRLEDLLSSKKRILQVICFFLLDKLFDLVSTDHCSYDFNKFYHTILFSMFEQMVNHTEKNNLFFKNS